LSSIWAAVAFRGLADPKRRLSHLLTLEERRGLSKAMLTDVLGALHGTSAIGRLVVVSRDQSVLDFGARLGADPLEERGRPGYRSAAERVASAAASAGARALLLCAADMPLATAEDFDDLLAELERAPIVLASSLDEQGTNAMLVQPPGAMRYRFGRNSLAAHLREASRSGLLASVLKRPKLGLDVDQPDDLRLLLEQREVSPENATFRYLDSIGLAERVSGA
jgi:2-phospho-L-lactate guanylyltransferase